MIFVLIKIENEMQKKKRKKKQLIFTCRSVCHQIIVRNVHQFLRFMTLQMTEYSFSFAAVILCCFSTQKKKNTLKNSYLFKSNWMREKKNMADEASPLNTIKYTTPNRLNIFVRIRPFGYTLHGHRATYIFAHLFLQVKQLWLSKTKTKYFSVFFFFFVLILVLPLCTYLHTTYELISISIATASIV